MKRTLNESLYQRCDLAFLEAIATTIKMCIARAPLASNEQRQALLEDVAFAVAAHLSGSAHGGRVDGQEVYPTLVYALGEEALDEVIYGRSVMHERAPGVSRSIAF